MRTELRQQRGGALRVLAGFEAVALALREAPPAGEFMTIADTAASSLP